MEKFVVGRYEYVNFPGLEKQKVKAKIDTGAQTNSIHCGSAKLIDVEGKSVLECTFLGNRKKKFQFEKFQVKRIKSSNGMAQERFIIYLTVSLHGKTFKSRFSLSKRENMNFPVLIGQNLLKRGFVVDVSKEYIAHQTIDL